MAKIKAALSFSTADALSYPINLSKSFSGLVDSGHVIKTKVLGIAQGSDAVTIAKANDKTDVAYVYICNLSGIKEEYIFVYVGTTNIVKIAGGEFSFIPAMPDIDLKVYGTEVGQMIEYGAFGVDDTQAKLG
tara:strand:+ start:130 stop:525 length:396 start_codon:yes stop_codon:yes gene_type:complete